MKLEFSWQIFEKISNTYQFSSKSVQWEPSCSIRTDGHTDVRMDIMKLIVAFHNFAIAPKIMKMYHSINYIWQHFFVMFIYIKTCRLNNHLQG
jgi:hypothetical protein